jgi:hypothetical protein
LPTVHCVPVLAAVLDGVVDAEVLQERERAVRESC